MRLGQSMRCNRYARRRGTVYVLVLSITSLLVILGIGGAMVSRVEIEKSELEQHQSATRWVAIISLDLTHKRINGETTWRSEVWHDVWRPSENYNGCRIQVKYVDEIDGVIGDDPMQPFRLYAKAEKGSAVRIYSVEMIPDSNGNLTMNPRSMRKETVD